MLGNHCTNLSLAQSSCNVPFSIYIVLTFTPAQIDVCKILFPLSFNPNDVWLENWVSFLPSLPSRKGEDRRRKEKVNAISHDGRPYSRERENRLCAKKSAEVPLMPAKEEEEEIESNMPALFFSTQSCTLFVTAADKGKDWWTDCTCVCVRVDKNRNNSNPFQRPAVRTRFQELLRTGRHGSPFLFTRSTPLKGKKKKILNVCLFLLDTN